MSKSKAIAFHGWGLSKATAESTFRPCQRVLDELNWHLDVVQAPHEVPLEELHRSGFANAKDHGRAWYRYNEGVFEGLQESFDWVESVFDRDQVEGVVAHSSGAAFAALAMRRNIFPSSVRWCVMIGAYCSEKVRQQMGVGAKIAVPTLFLTNPRDRTIRVDAVEGFARDFFSDVRFASYEGGLRDHFPPTRAQEYESVVQFIKEHP